MKTSIQIRKRLKKLQDDLDRIQENYQTDPPDCEHTIEDILDKEVALLKWALK